MATAVTCLRPSADVFAGQEGAVGRVDEGSRGIHVEGFHPGFLLGDTDPRGYGPFGVLLSDFQVIRMSDHHGQGNALSVHYFCVANGHHPVVDRRNFCYNDGIEYYLCVIRDGEDGEVNDQGPLDDLFGRTRYGVSVSFGGELNGVGGCCVYWRMSP